MQMTDNQVKSNNTLALCPFCGGEAEMLTAESMNGGYLFGIMCNDCRSRGDVYDNESEAIAAWNSRAPIEYEGWFYLPKPKEGIVDYGEPAITRTENGYKVRQIVDVVDEAARKWGDDLSEYIMRRICEVWNTRTDDYKRAAEYWQRMYEQTSERTCEFSIKDNMNETDGMGDVWIECSACHCVFDYYADEWLMKMSYCPNCGVRRVDE